MNTDVMFSSKTDLWETPQEFFDKLDAEFHFNLDVCATPENTKCAAYYTPEMDGLSQPWYGRCWCNPPYGRQVGRWVEKAASGAALASGAASARGAASASGAASARCAALASGAALASSAALAHGAALKTGESQTVDISLLTASAAKSARHTFSVETKDYLCGPGAGLAIWRLFVNG